MANYYCHIRTNYFHVKDPDAFRKFMGRVYGTEDGIELWEEKDADGNLVFGFGTEGGIAGLRDDVEEEFPDTDDASYDLFIDGLQEHLCDGDAVIIMEAGHEKLNYVVGSATVVTKTQYEHLDISDLATAKAGELLGNPEWTTQCDY